MSSSQSFFTKRLFSLSLGNFTFSPGWLTTLITLMLLTLLINLGLWQTNRGEYKEALQARYDARSQSSTIDLETLMAMAEDSMDFPIALKGRYQHSKIFLLDNRTHRGIPGFHVITPLDIGSHYVLINQGWVAQGKTRSDMPDFPQPKGKISVSGITHVPNPNFFVLKEDDYESVTWPFIIQKINIEKSSSLLDKPLAPFVIRLNPDKESGFVREWHSNPMTPEKHFGYAFQWFSLALALSVIYVTVNTQRKNKININNNNNT